MATGQIGPCGQVAQLLVVWEYEKKTRTCTNPTPDRSGNNCVGEPSEYTVCPNEPCNVIGKFPFSILIIMQI